MVMAVFVLLIVVIPVTWLVVASVVHVMIVVDSLMLLSTCSSHSCSLNSKVEFS